MSTTEGWAANLFNAMDSKGVDLAPAINFNMWASIYFVLFMLFGGLFIMNLFVSIVISSF